MTPQEKLDRLFNALSRDISDRRGLKWEWTKIDADVMADIRRTWIAIIERNLGYTEKCNQVSLLDERDIELQKKVLGLQAERAEMQAALEGAMELLEDWLFNPDRQVGDEKAVERARAVLAKYPK